MNNEKPIFSEDFYRLYCNPTVYETFSTLHPVSFSCILPFQKGDPFVDNPLLLAAETSHLANRNVTTRLAVVDAYGECGLLSQPVAANVRSVVDFYEFDAEFFEFMGDTYANSGSF